MDKKTTPMSEAANPADGKGPDADLTDRLSASFFGAPQQSSYALFDCVRVSFHSIARYGDSLAAYSKYLPL